MATENILSSSNHTHTHIDYQRLAEHYGKNCRGQEADDGEDAEETISAQEMARRWVRLATS